MKRLVRVLFGYRDDLDLSVRWWHRLLKVLYVLALTLAVIAVGFLAFDSKPNLERKNVSITGELARLFETSDRSIPNLIPGFLALPGEVATMNDAGALESQSEYLLGRSFCTVDAIRHVESVVKFWNLPERNNYRPGSYTVAAALARFNSDKRSQDDLGMCWLDEQLSSLDGGQFVKYQFTSEARVKATLAFFIKALRHSQLPSIPTST